MKRWKSYSNIIVLPLLIAFNFATVTIESPKIGPISWTTFVKLRLVSPRSMFLHQPPIPRTTWLWLLVTWQSAGLSRLWSLLSRNLCSTFALRCFSLFLPALPLQRTLVLASSTIRWHLARPPGTFRLSFKYFEFNRVLIEWGCLCLFFSIE